MYNLGESIIFTAAKKIFKNHIGDSYFLLGEEKLASGEMIAFEYAFSPETEPFIWESIEAFLARRKIEKEQP